MAIHNIKKIINIYDINLILIFVGFPLFTTFVDNSLGSIVYRAIAAVIGLTCIVRSRLVIRGFTKNKTLVLFLAIYILLTLKMVYELFLGVDKYTPYPNSRNLAMLFCFGVCWIPFLGAICNFDKIHRRTIILLIFVILIGSVITGVIHRADNIDNGIGRVGMNARQGSLAFGDNSAYLAIISGCLIKFKKKINIIIYILAIVGLFLGMYGCAIAASRGPFVSMIAGLFFIFLTLKPAKKLSILSICIVLIISGAISLKSIEEISPTMTQRLDMTISDGDTSGRDEIFSDALRMIDQHPLLGTNPIILESNSFTSYHNVYLEIGVGLGIFGFIIFIGLILSLMIRTMSNKFIRRQLFSSIMAGLFWFYIFRGLTGVDPMQNCVYITVVSFICIISNSKYKIEFAETNNKN